MRKSIPATCFVCAWQELGSLPAVARLFGVTPDAAKVRAHRLRHLGVPLARLDAEARQAAYPGHRQRGVKARSTRRLIRLARMA